MNDLVCGQRALNTLIDDVERHWTTLLDSFFSPTSVGDLKNKLKSGGYPKIDVLTKDGNHVIMATVPGVNPDDLVIEMLDGDNGDLRNGKIKYVRISGQMAEEYRRDDGEWAKRELFRRSFSRAIALPGHIKDDPEATVKNGILTLVWKVPKDEKVLEARKIPIKKE